MVHQIDIFTFIKKLMKQYRIIGVVMLTLMALSVVSLRIIPEINYEATVDLQVNNKVFWPLDIKAQLKSFLQSCNKSEESVLDNIRDITPNDVAATLQSAPYINSFLPRIDLKNEITVTYRKVYSSERPYLIVRSQNREFLVRFLDSFKQGALPYLSSFLKKNLQMEEKRLNAWKTSLGREGETQQKLKCQIDFLKQYPVDSVMETFALEQRFDYTGIQIREVKHSLGAYLFSSIILSLLVGSIFVLIEIRKQQENKEC